MRSFLENVAARFRAREAAERKRQEQLERMRRREFYGYDDYHRGGSGRSRDDDWER